ncbi:MAG: nucleotidyltransferase domain-containing protein [Acetobacteraceae bacterium]|nr:nucleotidyltransferase domain-containing protein [Acetobacteraceae bacterium]
MRNVQLGQLVSPGALARLLAFKQDVIQAFPGAVEGMILFGSRARGDAQTDSDYDVAVLLNGCLADEWHVCKRISDLAWDHEADGCIIQPVPVNAEAFRSRAGFRTELAMRIGAEGIPLR